MLVLTRKIDEEILIGETRVKVLSVSAGKVKLGVTADTSIPIVRGPAAPPSRSSQEKP